MKAIPPTLIATTVAVFGFLLVAQMDGLANPPSAQTAVQTEQTKKRSLFSSFRRQPAAPAQQQQQQFQQHQGVPQQQAAAEEPRRPRFRLPRLKKPDFSRLPKLKMPNIKVPKLKVPKLKVPKLKMPNLKMPKVKMPRVKMPQMKVKMPKLSWPFKRKRQVSQQIQDYPNGVRNPRLGGAFGIIKMNKVKLYEIGPSQPFGPDEILDSGTMVTIRSNDKSWAYVTLKDGRSGYIGLDQVRLAGRDEVPRSLTNPVRAPRNLDLMAENSLPSYREPEIVPPALPMAAAELPETAEPEVNPLLGQVGTDPLDPLDPASPVDSPEVLFEPFLDPVPSDLPGGPEPFLDDSIPSIEEELRAIQDAKAREASAEDAGEEEAPEDEA